MTEQLFAPESGPLPYDTCSCSDCGRVFKVAQLETVTEQESWEHPTYEVDLCPDCPDGGCIDDYWNSKAYPHESD